MARFRTDMYSHDMCIAKFSTAPFIFAQLDYRAEPRYMGHMYACTWFWGLGIHYEALRCVYSYDQIYY